MHADRLLLITSIGPRTLADGSARRLFESLNSIQHVPVTMVCGNRASLNIDSTTKLARCEVHVLPLAPQNSLSSGRNTLIEWSRQQGLITEQTVINFPDDDSWFLEASDAVGAALRSLHHNDVVVGRFAPSVVESDTKRFSASSGVLRPKQTCLVANSVSMFWRASAMEVVGPFDEALGAGTRLSSSEDLDVLLRALAANLKVSYQPDVLIGHPYGLTKGSAYYVGNVAAIRKNAPQLPALWPTLARRMAGGARRVTKGEVALADFRLAFRHAITGISA